MNIYKKNIRTRVYCVIFHLAVWFCRRFVCSFVYYGVSLNVGSLSGDRYMNVFLLGMVDLPALAVVIIVNNTYVHTA